MATVYKIQGEFTSAFVNYPPEEIKAIIENYLSTHQDSKTGLGFESIHIKVERK
jgi:uroporphyrinogen-III decarboxylase